MIYKPTIIIKCLSTQSTYIQRTYGQMFYYTDKAELYYDTQNGGRVLVEDITILQYERNRANFTPNYPTRAVTDEYLTIADGVLIQPSVYVYVVETNTLYQYVYSNRTWNIVYGVYGVRTVAQTTTPEGNAVIIYPDDVTSNGILNDGSVIVRDSNRMICGQLRSNGYTFNILSLIGGQINIDPSGTLNGDGCLQINALSPSLLNGDLVIFGNLITADKSDWNKQYRLITENIQISSYTLIKAGSTICLGSRIGDTTYDKNTILDSDIETNTEGVITTNSKIYMGSIINNLTLKPPFVFDVDAVKNTISYQTNHAYTTKNWSIIDNTTIKIDANSPFKSIGDECYIYEVDNTIVDTLKTLQFNDISYTIDAINILGTTATIKYYGTTVKILP